MADSTEDKTAWRSKLGPDSFVDVLDYKGNKWRRGVVTDQNASDVHVLFTDSNSSESQWLLRDSPRLAPPASKMHVEPETPTAANKGSDTHAASCIDGGSDTESPMYDEFLLRPGAVVDITDSNRDHEYEARVLIREHDRILVSYKGWPLIHSKWVNFVSRRYGFDQGKLADWRCKLKMGQDVQVGFRKSPDCLGASRWLPGKVVSLSKDASRLLQVEVEWTEHGEAKREWRNPNDDFLVQPGAPMPCVGDGGVVTMNRIVNGETIATVLPPSHECDLHVATERLADLEREKEQARASIELLTREANKTIAMLNDLKAQSAQIGRLIESHAQRMTEQVAAVGSGESPPSTGTIATQARKRTRRG